MARSKQAQTTKSITFRLDSSTVKEIEQLAQKDNRSLNNFVETVLKRTVSEKKLQMI